ncbi:MAG: DMT family transporter [Alphaproteobacteria bacterium]|nr:DMT family transporter [Alphaproteobacteria bacterium]
MNPAVSFLAAYRRLPGQAKGLLLVVVSTVAFAVMQALISYTTRTEHPFEVVFWRNLFGLAAIAPFFLRHGFGVFRTKRLHHHAFRNVIHLGSMMMFFYGVSLTPLATVSALSFTSPLFAALLAVILLRERIRARRVTALVIGFIGTLIIIRPGFIELQPGSLMVLGSSFIWGFVMVNIKSLGSSESSLTSTAYMAVIMTPLSLIPALFHWSWPPPATIGLFAAMGALGTLAHIALAQAFREADATAVLPADFLRMIWASLLGFAFFGEVPEVLVWVGGAMIFGATIYIAYREARRVRTPLAASAVLPVDMALPPDAGSAPS